LAKTWAAFPMHSAKTTILLDDSVLKAQLQPWNHLCIPEYVSRMRANDLETLKYPSATVQTRVQACAVSVKIPSSIPTSSSAAKPFTSLDEISLESVSLEVKHPFVVPKFDETLLAVIGILDELKDELDVGKWIRTGGLCVYEPSPLGSTIGSSVDSKDTENQPSQESNPLSLQDIAKAMTSVDDALGKQSTPSMWFERETVVDNWASKGRKALRELNIEVIPGIKA
jgi:hypothetical protein